MPKKQPPSQEKLQNISRPNPDPSSEPQYRPGRDSITPAAPENDSQENQSLDEPEQ